MMSSKQKTFGSFQRKHLCALAVLLPILLAGCGMRSVDYTPIEREDFAVSNPEEQGLAPKLLDRFYKNAAELDTIYSLLVIKNSHLIAESYFNGGEMDKRADLASVTKSYTSALAGLALEQGCLPSLDLKLIDYFPEYKDQITDPRKLEITIEDLLKMRSGYPWEEFNPPYMSQLFSSPDWVPHMVDFPLVYDPGTEFGYSNLGAHLAGVIVARACGTGLLVFAEEYLFEPIDAQMGTWQYDPNNYYFGSGSLALTARNAAKFGLLYLNGGNYQDDQILPASWVEDSLNRYSNDIYGEQLGSYFKHLGYGYFWWSAEVGDHHFNYAWGHGGNLIVILPDLDMVIVTTASTLPGLEGEESWKKEGAIIDLVGEFISTLPEQ